MGQRKVDKALKDIKSRPKTAIVLLHEIYGINNHILDTSKRFEDEGYDVHCIDLLNNKTFDYEEAEEAYSYFIDKIGFNRAKLKVVDFIKSIFNYYEKIFLIGYSIGATVAWLCSEEHGLLSGIAGYYGSRIRDYATIEPKAETVLFFPVEEKGFNVESLIEQLEHKEKVRVYKFEGLHGFADPYSKHYSRKEKELSEKILDKFISGKLGESMGAINDNKGHTVEFKHITGQDMIEEIKILFLEYVKSLNVDLAFQNFEEEFKTLPGKYGPTDGRLILALVDGKAAGCIALRKISEGICEMKRLYVRDDYRGLGIGKKLIDMIIEEARKLNYNYARLDTLPTMKKAQDLYTALGFYDVEPYVYNPIEGTRFLELNLKD